MKAYLKMLSLTKVKEGWQEANYFWSKILPIHAGMRKAYEMMINVSFFFLSLLLHWCIPGKLYFSLIHSAPTLPPKPVVPDFLGEEVMKRWQWGCIALLEVAWDNIN